MASIQEENRKELREKLEAKIAALKATHTADLQTVETNWAEVQTSDQEQTQVQSQMEQSLHALMSYRELATSATLATDSIKSLQASINTYSAAMAALKAEVTTAASMVTATYGDVSKYSSLVGSMTQLVLDEYGDKSKEFKQAHGVLDSKEVALDHSEHTRIDLLELTAQVDGLDLISASLTSAVSASESSSSQMLSGYQNLLTTTLTDLNQATATELNNLNDVVQKVDTWSDSVSTEKAVATSKELVEQELKELPKR